VRITREKPALAAASSLLILAVKPKDMAQALAELRGLVRADHLVISVAAGIPLAMIEEALPAGPVIRAMPNTSAAVQESATVLASGTRATETHLRDAALIFEAVGDVAVVDEELLDVVTALSGSGPAYVYHLIEAMIHAGSELGLDGGLARRLAVQTLVGAARMLAETREDPGDLRRRVTSPGGTTMAALQTLEARGFAQSVRAAVDRAAQRARELALEFGGPPATGNGSAGTD
jgi:pyrroline-5-carboxylate reductase